MTKLRGRVNEAYKAIGEAGDNMLGCKAYLELVDLVDAEVCELGAVLEVVGTDRFFANAVQRARTVLVDSTDVKGLMFTDNGLTVVGDKNQLCHAFRYNFAGHTDPVSEVHGDYYGAAIKKAARAQLLGSRREPTVRQLKYLDSMMVGHGVREMNEPPLHLGHASSRPVLQPNHGVDLLERTWNVGVTGMQAKDNVHDWMSRVLEDPIREDGEAGYFENDVDVLAGYYDQVVADRTIDELRRLHGLEVPARSAFIGAHSMAACDIKLKGGNLH